VVALRFDRHRCAGVLAAGRVEFTVLLLEPVLPDARLARVETRGLGCTGDLTAKWPSGPTLPAGSALELDAKWMPREESSLRPDGLLLVARYRVVVKPMGPVAAVRTWLAVTMRRLYGTRAGTVDALVVNRRGAMPPELKNRYARAGLVHILSISGFHVGVIVGWIVLLARAAGLSGPRAALAAAGIAAVYVLFLDWPPPAARAALLAGLAAQFHLRQRNVETWSLLAFTFLLVLLFDPWAIFDAGAWLSAGALTGALLATRWSDRAVGTSWFWRTFSGSIGATLATAPISAAMFGTVSLAGLGLNFIAIPLAAVAVPGILLSLMAAAILPPLAAPLAAGSGALLGLLDQVAWWGGSWSGAAITVPAEPRSALPWLVLIVLTGWGISGHSNRWVAVRRWTLAAAAASWLLLLFEGVRGADVDSGLTLHFLDVGQGDAAVLHTPGGHWVLIDGGPVGDGWDAGRRVVVPFLERHRASTVALVLLSHAHADHLGGLPAVVDRYPTGQVMEPADLVADPLYGGWLDQLEAHDIPWAAARAGQTFVVDSVRFTVMHPDTTWPGWQEDLNEDSAVILVEYRGFRALFPGDAGLPAEEWLKGRIGPVDVLKVGHHGSRSATGQRWLEELRPEVAVISTGKGNRYGHPHQEVVQRLVADSISLWRTDQDGAIEVAVDSGGFSISADRRTKVYVRRKT
jgi:competence protein ComEC